MSHNKEIRVQLYIFKHIK